MSVAALLVALAAIASAIQINPNYGEKYEIQNVCGKWRQGADNKIGQCSPTSTGGGGLHFETDITDSGVHLGPNIAGSNDILEFGNADRSGNYNTFKSTTTYWTDPPCFTRKKYCTAYDEAASTCPTAKRKDCPSWQVTGKKKDCPGSVPGPGSAPYCFGTNCPATSCMDEEYYPGCGAYPSGTTINFPNSAGEDAEFPGGIKEQTIVMKGTVTNFFKKNAQVAAETCEVMCPCKAVSDRCAWDIGTVGAYYSCSKLEYEAYNECMNVRDPSGDNLPAFRDPKADAWNTPYSTVNDHKTGVYKNAKPVRFEISNIEVTPHTDDQVTYLDANCPCKTWVKGGTQDIVKCADDGGASTCKYLEAQGMFHQTGDVLTNCPTTYAVQAGLKPRCKFAQVYRHDNAFMYIGQRHSNYAAMMRATVRAEDIFTLANVNPDCIASERTDVSQLENVGYEAMEDSPASVTATASTMLMAALAIAAMFNGR